MTNRSGTKKRKLNNSLAKSSTPKPTKKDLSHEEIWDDSALIRSWNDALAEYDFYHSIHARGEDVDDVLKRYHAENGAEMGTGEGDSGDEEGEILDGDGAEQDGLVVDEVERDREVVGDKDEPVHLGISSTLHGHAVRDAIAAAEPVSSTLPVPGVDQDGTNSGSSLHHADPQAQILENIKMAYYWAGYYSGLYDGQKQAGSHIQPQTQTQTQPDIHPQSQPQTNAPPQSHIDPSSTIAHSDAEKEA